VKATIAKAGAVGGWMAPVPIEPDLEVSLLAYVPRLDVAGICTVLGQLRLRALQITD